jgi:hypothetical protein
MLTVTQAHDVAAAVHAHAGRMSDLRTALRERQEELAILGRGGAATGAAGGGGARATASGGAGVRQVVLLLLVASAYLGNPLCVYIHK